MSQRRHLPVGDSDGARVSESYAETLDALAAKWTRLGALFGVRATAEPVDVEVLLVETARVAPYDERLFVVAASWLAQSHGFVNGRRLSALAVDLEVETSAVLGALLSLAQEAAGRAPELDTALTHCRRLAKPRPLFANMDAMAVLRERVHRHSLPLFTAWGLWHDDATLKSSAVRPRQWMIERVPELQARAFLGPSVEADLMSRALIGDITVRDLAQTARISYAAAHDAASRLVSRGLLVRERVAQRQLLRPTPTAHRILVCC